MRNEVLPIQGANTWRFDTSDGGSLPTNTNDGDLDGPSLQERSEKDSNI